MRRQRGRTLQMTRLDALSDFWRKMRLVYKFHVCTSMEGPAPTQVQSAAYGPFIRAPFPTEGLAMWGFKYKDGADKFQETYSAFVKPIG